MNTFPLTFKPANSGEPDDSLVESPTCADSATFALRVLDTSMEPEFKQGCIIVIDPSARVTEGSYVLVQVDADSSEGDRSDKDDDEDCEYVLRQTMRVSPTSLSLMALQADFKHSELIIERQQLRGVVVQRAGTRRRDAKHYR